MRKSWTPERVSRLRVMAAAGRSMGEAAEQLGCTRNAIAGAAFRHDIPFECSAARHDELTSAGAKRAWDRDDGRRRRANAEHARKVFADWWARGQA